jgi:glycyl-tRNA synthetase beta subunit
MRTTISAMLIGFLFVVMTGCGHMHPRADEFLTQAKGASGVETQINLTNMVEASAKSLQGQTNYEPGLDTLHNQLYALKKAGCEVTEQQSKTVAYAKAQTLRKEVKVIFYRLWKNKEDQAFRDQHLDLLSKRVAELREALQAVKS